MSRTPAREALLRLEVEGLVRLQPKKGAVVATFSPHAMDDVLEARVLVENHTARKSFAQRATLLPEVLIARFLGMKVAAASVITNYGAGMTGAELSHHETKDMAPVGGARLAAILAEMIAAGENADE